MTNAIEAAIDKFCLATISLSLHRLAQSLARSKAWSGSLDTGWHSSLERRRHHNVSDMMQGHTSVG